MKKEIWGCDIGNAFGYISLLNSESSDPESSFPAVYPRLEKIGMPTAAYIASPDGKTITIEVFDGRAAEDKYKDKSKQIIRAIKTRMREETIVVSGIEKPVKVSDIYAAIVRDLIKLGNKKRAEDGKDPIYDVVFTFPAKFSADPKLLERMQKSIENIEFDGEKVKVIDRLPEPGAVAIDYLYYIKNIAPEEVKVKKNEYTVLVYDLGYGTFDAAIVTANSHKTAYKMHEMNCDPSDPEAGGKDFDDILIRKILNLLKNEYLYEPKNENERDLIREKAIDIKHQLTFEDDATADFQLSDGRYIKINISKSDFENLSRGLLNRTFEKVSQMISYAKEKSINIDLIVLSGGASQMPMVRNGLCSLFPDIPVSTPYRPSQAVSYGAARYALGTAEKPKKNKDLSKERRNSEGITKEDSLGNQVLKKTTLFSYGLILDGHVSYKINCDIDLPACSKRMPMINDSSHFCIALYRSKKKRSTDVNDCIEIISIPFDLPRKTEFDCQLIVRDDYSVKVRLYLKDGSIIEKSSSDPLKDLLR